MTSLHDVYFCQFDRTDELNKRVSSRNIPDSQLDTAYFYRPESTRFVKFPSVDTRKKPSVEKVVMKPYSVSETFNPGTSAPFSGYARNVDVENSLKNIVFPLQAGAQSKFIPSSTSSMYKKDDIYNQNMNLKQREILERQENFNKCNPNQENIGNDIFGNHTRQQTKNLFQSLMK